MLQQPREQTKLRAPLRREGEGASELTQRGDAGDLVVLLERALGSSLRRRESLGRELPAELLVAVGGEKSFERVVEATRGSIAILGIRRHRTPADLREGVAKVKIEDLLERDSIEMNNSLISKEVDGKVIMITGAAGSIGSEIVRQLLNYFPSKIILVDQAESALYDLEFVPS